MSVTRYITGESRRESRDPYRTEPNLTGPTSLVAEPASWRSVSNALDGDAMMTLRAFVVWGEGVEPQPILDVIEYQAPDRVHPNGRLLIVGRGQCPLWADRAQVVLA